MPDNKQYDQQQDHPDQQAPKGISLIEQLRLRKLWMQERSMGDTELDFRDWLNSKGMSVPYE